jgi:hypothetical protein
MSLCSLSGKDKRFIFVELCFDSKEFLVILRFPLILLITSNIPDFNLRTWSLTKFNSSFFSFVVNSSLWYCSSTSYNFESNCPKIASFIPNKEGTVPGLFPLPFIYEIISFNIDNWRLIWAISLSLSIIWFKNIFPCSLIPVTPVFILNSLTLFSVILISASKTFSLESINLSVF